MQLLLLRIVIAGMTACLTHEGGHYLTALAFGRKLRFRFAWGRLFGVVPVPRGVWNMPYMARWKQRIVAVAGFGAEFLCAGIAAALGWPLLLLMAATHLFAYPFYAGSSNDFNWL